MSIGQLDLEEAAKKAAGNWQDFTCFVWWRKEEIADPENWAIIYTHHRDSGLLDQSNAAVIEKTLKPFAEGNDPDLVFESHHHWAGRSCRWLFDKGFSKRHKSPKRSKSTTTLRSNWIIIRFSTRRITRIGNTKRPSKTSTLLRGS